MASVSRDKGRSNSPGRDPKVGQSKPPGLIEAGWVAACTFVTRHLWPAVVFVGLVAPVALGTAYLLRKANAPRLAVEAAARAAGSAGPSLSAVDTSTPIAHAVTEVKMVTEVKPLPSVESPTEAAPSALVVPPLPPPPVDIFRRKTLAYSHTVTPRRLVSEKVVASGQVETGDEQRPPANTALLTNNDTSSRTDHKMEKPLTTVVTPIIFSPPRDPKESGLRLLRELNFKQNR